MNYEYYNEYDLWCYEHGLTKNKESWEEFIEYLFGG